MNTLPVIKIELESMRATIHTMLTRHAAMLDTQINEAVDKFCSEEQLAAVIAQTVKDQITMAVKDEIRNQFSYTGAGRKAIREAVNTHFDELWPDTKEQ